MLAFLSPCFFDFLLLLLFPNYAAFSNQYLPLPVLSSTSAPADLAASSDSCLWASLDSEAAGFLFASSGPEALALVRAG